MLIIVWRRNWCCGGFTGWGLTGAFGAGYGEVKRFIIVVHGGIIVVGSMGCCVNIYGSIGSGARWLRLLSACCVGCWGDLLCVGLDLGLGLGKWVGWRRLVVEGGSSGGVGELHRLMEG
jgi:hypothetical protein